MNTRIETDSIGEIQVPIDALYGAQTQRSVQNFPIGSEIMSIEIIYAYAIIKKSCAIANGKNKAILAIEAEAIVAVCDEILSGTHNAQFPLSVWQTGSGTQTNMNVNEVIANRGNQLFPEVKLHPNDHVNRSQSSNDTFPTSMHIATATLHNEIMQPALKTIINALQEKQIEWDSIIKIGRTHLMDAVPLRLGDILGGWINELHTVQERLELALTQVYQLTLGGTAVGSGIGTTDIFREQAIKNIADITKQPYTAGNTFSGSAFHTALTNYSSELNTLAGILLKITNDIRWLASGPRSGFGELILPANEPGSSIMPGKVNPTQCEMLTQICLQVMGNHTTINMANSQGNFELNVYKPLIAYNLIQSMRLLSDGLMSFTSRCIKDMTVNKEQIQKHLTNSLMLITNLNPHIGYEKSADIAKLAHKEGLTLCEANEQLGYVSSEDWNVWMDVEKMV